MKVEGQTWLANCEDSQELVLHFSSSLTSPEVTKKYSLCKGAQSYN